MRPDTKHDKALNAGRARARMYLKAHFGWLRGYPLGQGDGWVDWAVRPADDLSVTQVRLDREALRRAEFAVNKLLHRFGRAFPQVVEDPGRWPIRARQFLDRLKAAIHHGTPLPAGLPEARVDLPAAIAGALVDLLRVYPTLQPIADAFSWLLYFTPGEAVAAAGWLGASAVRLSGLPRAFGPERGVALAVTLWGMAHADGPERVAQLLHYLNDPAAHAIPVDDVETYLKAWADGLEREHGHWTNWRPQPPATTIAPQVLKFVDWLAGQPAKARRGCLDLFNLLLGDELLAPWRPFWPEVERAVREAKRVAELPDPAAAKAHAVFMRELANAPRPKVWLEAVLGRVRELAGPRCAALRAQVTRTLPLLPLVDGDRAVRAAFLEGWLNLTKWHDPAKGAGLVASLVARFHAYLAGPATPALLAPWRPVIVAWERGHLSGVSFPGYFLCGNAQAARLGPVYFGALKALCAAGAADFIEQDADNLAELAEITRDAAATAECFRDLCAVGLREEYLREEWLRSADRFRRAGVPFGRAVKGLHRFVGDDREADTFAALAAAVEVLHAAGLGAVAGRLADHGEYAPLAALGRAEILRRRLRDAGDLGAEAALASAPPAWAGRYPAELHPALRRLAALSDGAEAAAGELLSKEFPDPAAVARELAAVEERLRSRPDDAGLAKRRAALATRLTAAPRVSPVRLDHLRTKLDLAADRLLVAGRLRQAEDRLRARLAELLDVAAIPDWLLERPYSSLLAAALELTGPVRELALRIFRRRCGSPPWTFRDEPANRQFVERLRALGIDPAPWLDPPPGEWVEGKNGRRVRLAFEDDPREVLRMGEHFGTCLSPGSFNFFSAVVNAADVNKRVVYARDAGNRVVGRCLLALTDAGRVLTFHDYCHEPDLGFGALVGALAERLAGAMGTHVATTGAVAPLLAPEWYDDGPRDLCGRFAFLNHDAPFRRCLNDLDRADVVPALQKACGPLPLNEVTLPLILGLPELDRRPHLVLPLLPLLEAVPHLPREAWWRAAELAHAAGEVAFAAGVLNRHLAPELVKQIRRHGLVRVNAVVAALARIDPSAALRVVRATRATGVRDDGDETDDDRRAILAAAHERLGRPELARRLREARGRR
jgi:hypothetical protein